MNKRHSDNPGDKARKRTPPRRLFLIGAALTVPWFVTFYIFEMQDLLAMLLALVGYGLIFVAVGRVVAIWIQQRKDGR